MTEYPIQVKREREEAQVVVLGKRNINNVIQKQPKSCFIKLEIKWK